MISEISDVLAQSVSGGGQLTTYNETTTYTFSLQTSVVGQTNAGGQLKTGKTGSGWTDVTSTQWVLTDTSVTTELVSRESVAGKGGTTINSFTVFQDSNGNLLESDPTL